MNNLSSIVEFKCNQSPQHCPCIIKKKKPNGINEFAGEILENGEQTLRYG